VIGSGTNARPDETLMTAASFCFARNGQPPDRPEQVRGDGRLGGREEAGVVQILGQHDARHVDQHVDFGKPAENGFRQLIGGSCVAWSRRVRREPLVRTGALRRVSQADGSVRPS